MSATPHEELQQFIFLGVIGDINPIERWIWNRVKEQCDTTTLIKVIKNATDEFLLESIQNCGVKNVKTIILLTYEAIYFEEMEAKGLFKQIFYTILNGQDLLDLFVLQGHNSSKITTNRENSRNEIATLKIKNFPVKYYAYKSLLDDDVKPVALAILEHVDASDLGTQASEIRNFFSGSTIAKEATEEDKNQYLALQLHPSKWDCENLRSKWRKKLENEVKREVERILKNLESSKNRLKGLYDLDQYNRVGCTMFYAEEKKQYCGAFAQSVDTFIKVINESLQQLSNGKDETIAKHIIDAICDIFEQLCRNIVYAPTLVEKSEYVAMVHAIGTHPNLEVRCRATRIIVMKRSSQKLAMKLAIEDKRTGVYIAARFWELAMVAIGNRNAAVTVKQGILGLSYLLFYSKDHSQIITKQNVIEALTLLETIPVGGEAHYMFYCLQQVLQFGTLEVIRLFTDIRSPEKYYERFLNCANMWGQRLIHKPKYNYAIRMFYVCLLECCNTRCFDA